jgi:tRNA-2-methylthio-N6-dimethylallyladenosine synthase
MNHNGYYIETYGCQMNEHDSEKMAAMLERIGLTEVSSADEADVVVINTCSIREKAEHKVYSALGKLKALKRNNPGLVTVVSGCVAQQEQERLLKRVDHLDLVLGTHNMGDLPALVEEIRHTGDRIARVDLSEDVDSLHFTAPCKGRSPVCSYVTVMQGCTNFCTYCVVPHTRGPEQSRMMDEILNEVQLLADRGMKEITLLGQNVNAYGKDLGNGTSFSGLLAALNRVDGISRIRFTTSHPRDFDEGLVRAIADLGSVCEHIHLPLQSGSDRILKAMNRGYTRSDYLEKIAMLREAVPGMAVTADIIVGFPGESDDDFRRTMSALDEIRYDQIFSFKYSPRPGTVAAKIPDQVPEEVKIRRLAEVHRLQETITGEYHKRSEGTVREILIEGRRERTNQPFGRTRTNKIVNLLHDDGVESGDLVSAKITRGLKHSLVGEQI